MYFIVFSFINKSDRHIFGSIKLHFSRKIQSFWSKNPNTSSNIIFLHELSHIHLRLCILNEGIFENKKKILTFVFTGGHQHQARKFFHHTDTLQSQYYNIGMGEYLWKKLLAVVPHPERWSKLDNNWESTNNLKLWLLNISRYFLLGKIPTVVDSYKTFSWLTTPSCEKWKN